MNGTARAVRAAGATAGGSWLPWLSDGSVSVLGNGKP